MRLLQLEIKWSGLYLHSPLYILARCRRYIVSIPYGSGICSEVCGTALILSQRIASIIHKLFLFSSYFYFFISVICDSITNSIQGLNR